MRRWPKPSAKSSTTTSVIDLKLPRRQHPAGLIIFLGVNIVRALRAFFPIIITFAVAEDARLALLTGGIILGSLIVLFSVLEYVRFRYHVERGSTLVVERGVIRRERLEIPFTRIQAVHLTQSLLQRILGLTGVAIDTAGTSENELQIRALKAAEARALRTLLSPGPDATAVNTPAIAPSDQTLFTLSLRDLLRIGLTMNHFRNGMLAFGAVVGIGGQVTDALFAQLESLPAWQLSLLSILSGFLWIAGIFVFAGLGVFISMGVTAIRYFGLRLSLVGQDRLELASGLLKRNEFAILLRKVQILRWRNSFLQRAFDLESLQILQARSSSEADEQAVKLVIPGLGPDDSRTLLAIFTASESNAPGLREIRPIPLHLHLSRLSYVLPIIPLVTAMALFAGWTVLPVLLLLAWLPYAWRAGRWAHDSRVARTDGNVIWVHKGWWIQTRSLLQPRRLQRVTVTQHILQVRRSSANLHLHTAAGTITLRYISASAAYALADEFLARVESHEGPWM